MRDMLVMHFCTVQTGELYGRPPAAGGLRYRQIALPAPRSAQRCHHQSEFVRSDLSQHIAHDTFILMSPSVSGSIAEAMRQPELPRHAGDHETQIRSAAGTLRKTARVRTPDDERSHQLYTRL